MGIFRLPLAYIAAAMLGKRKGIVSDESLLVIDCRRAGCCMGCSTG
jgi:hypothetical protein